MVICEDAIGLIIESKKPFRPNFGGEVELSSSRFFVASPFASKNIMEHAKKDHVLNSIKAGINTVPIVGGTIASSIK